MPISARWRLTSRQQADEPVAFLPAAMATPSTIMPRSAFDGVDAAQSVLLPAPAGQAGT
jgi:hypothetical protein